jgi:hypothetical protein
VTQTSGSRVGKKQSISDLEQFARPPPPGVQLTVGAIAWIAARSGPSVSGMQNSTLPSFAHPVSFVKAILSVRQADAQEMCASSQAERLA